MQREFLFLQLQLFQNMPDDWNDYRAVYVKQEIPNKIADIIFSRKIFCGSN